MRLTLLMLFCAAPALAANMNARTPADPYQWLEDVSSPKALAWVRQQDAASRAVLEADKHFKPFYEAALAIGEAKDRVPMPSQLHGDIYNFWQDAAHVRGIWRHTSLADYRTAAPHWVTALDVDALAKQDRQNWVFHGVTCLEPEEKRCLVSLSDGGEDAATEREFDLETAHFVPGGFFLPRAKASADWETPDSLLVATDWGEGALTDSGYPFIVKRLKRGQNLYQAEEVFRGTKQDVSVNVAALADGAGHRELILQRGLDAFRSLWFRVTPKAVEQLALPEKSQVDGLVDNRLVVTVEEAWTPKGGAAIPAGSIATLDMARPDAPARLVVAPGPRQSIEEVAVSHGRIVASLYDNVRGRIITFAPTGEGWARKDLALPDNSSVGVVSTTPRNDQAFLSVTGFLTPGSLWFADLAGDAKPELVKQSPPRFDASKDVVEQFEATSTDGTKIPYFVVRPKDMAFDGSNPTLLYAYGGFQVSMLPVYSGVIGKLWLEQGHVYVLANIRGGGEFGPAWHEAALKTKRQTAYDDFAAVAKDIIARKITSPAKLGIEGGSNGGLLMGVEFVQHPDLWRAVVIEVPLLDMLRYEQIAAGASWIGEYGSVANPDERAFLARISPYANLRPDVKYPTPLIYTTTKDDRVGPQHARKFAALMAEMHLPYLYYEAIEGGHSAGANAKEVADERALEMTYLTRMLAE